MTAVSEELDLPSEPHLTGGATNRSGRGMLARPAALVVGAVGVVLAVSAPALANAEQLNSLIAIGILGLFAMSLDLVLGYGGMPTLGHAMFFGLGGYVAGVLAVRQTAELLVTLPLAMVGAGAAGYLIARLALRTQTLQFLMITFAFSGVVLAGIERLSEYTGGNDGLAGIPPPRLLGEEIATEEGIYYLVLSVLALSWILMWRLVRSPFGRMVVGIRDNAVRVRSLGVDPQRRLAVLFAVGSTFAAAAGALHVYFFKFISPTSAGFGTAADGLFMVIIGGPATLVGGLVGAAVVYLTREELTDVTESPNLFLGMLFVVFVLLVRGGLVGVVRRGAARARQLRIARLRS